MKKLLCFIALCVVSQALAQNKLVSVLEEKKGNRMAFYAINKDFKAYDALFEVKGSDFRQSKARPRWIRIPPTSKVLLKYIILLRDKEPKYTYSLQLTDSLSPRALEREFTVIDVPPPKITPKKQITIYTSENCSACDSIVQQLTANNYIFTEILLTEKPKVKASLGRMLNTELDSIQDPIINLGGHLYTWIKDYETLLQEVEK